MNAAPHTKEWISKFYIRLDAQGEVVGCVMTALAPTPDLIEVNQRAFDNYMWLLLISKTGSVRRNPHLIDREKPE